MTYNAQKIESISIEVADKITAMLAYWDKDQICRFANKSYLDWFGKNREDMIDKMTLEELLGPIYEKNKPYILGALNGQVQTFEREIPLPTQGGVRHSLANYYPKIVDGEVLGFFVHVADVTPMKLLEKDLVKSNEIISNQNRRLLNFSNIVSHNLKSYSNNIASIIELYTLEDSEDQKKQLFDYLKGISKSFSKTVNQLSEIARFQNQASLTHEIINLNDYVEHALSILRVQIETTNAVIKNNIPTDTTLMVNPVYMDSILLNLLSNSIKYRHPDRTPVIELSVFNEENRTVLVIKDNGLGIDLEKYGSQLFEIYKTFHSNKDAEGIGLFITKYQVETMGGYIMVDSKVGEGTSFSVYFNSQSNG